MYSGTVCPSKQMQTTKISINRRLDKYVNLLDGNHTAIKSIKSSPTDLEDYFHNIKKGNNTKHFNIPTPV